MTTTSRIPFRPLADIPITLRRSAGFLCRRLGFFRPVAVVTAVCFILTSVLGEGLYALADSRQDGTAAETALASSLIPYSLGRVTDACYFENAPTVVINVQDLHCHPEVQRNIGRILSLLDNTYPLERVYLEGSAGNLSTSWADLIADKAARKNVVDALIDTGKLTGAEYFSIESDKHGIVKGLEDEKLHRENLLRLNAIAKERAEIDAALSETNKAFAELEQRYYSAKNRKLADLVRKNNNGAITADKYYRLLFRLGMRTEDLYAYPNLGKMLRARELQKNLRYGKISRQLAGFLSILKQRMRFAAYNELVARSDNFSHLEGIYGDLAALAQTHLAGAGSPYPELQAFFEYIRANQDVNTVEFVREERKLVRQLHERFSATAAEREVVFLSDYLTYLEEYFANRISGDDYRYFAKNYGVFRALEAKYLPGAALPDLEPYRKTIDAFYAANLERNEAFIRNVLVGSPAPATPEIRMLPRFDHQVKVMESLRKGKKPVVVITGGFHTPGFTSLLKDRGISYLTITPNVTKDTRFADATYARLAAEQAKEILSQTLALRAYSMKLMGLPVDKEYEDISAQFAASKLLLVFTENPRRSPKEIATEINKESLPLGGAFEYRKRAGDEERFVFTLKDKATSKEMTLFVSYNTKTGEVGVEEENTGAAQASQPNNKLKEMLKSEQGSVRIRTLLIVTVLSIAASGLLVLASRGYANNFLYQGQYEALLGIAAVLAIVSGIFIGITVIAIVVKLVGRTVGILWKTVSPASWYRHILNNKKTSEKLAAAGRERHEDNSTVGIMVDGVLSGAIDGRKLMNMLLGMDRAKVERLLIAGLQDKKAAVYAARMLAYVNSSTAKDALVRVMETGSADDIECMAAAYKSLVALQGNEAVSVAVHEKMLYSIEKHLKKIPSTIAAVVKEYDTEEIVDEEYIGNWQYHYTYGTVHHAVTEDRDNPEYLEYSALRDQLRRACENARAGLAETSAVPQPLNDSSQKPENAPGEHGPNNIKEALKSERGSASIKALVVIAVTSFVIVGSFLMAASPVVANVLHVPLFLNLSNASPFVLTVIITAMLGLALTAVIAMSRAVAGAVVSFIHFAKLSGELKKMNPDRWAIEELGQGKRRRSLEKLVALLNRTKNDSVRLVVIESLGTLGDTRAIAPLRAYLEKASDIGIASDAQGDQRVSKPLVTQVNGKNDTDIKIAILTSLGMIGDEQVVTPLREYLQGRNDDSMTIKVIKSLAVLGDFEPIARQMGGSLSMPVVDAAYSALSQRRVDRRNYPDEFNRYDQLHEYDEWFRSEHSGILTEIDNEKTHLASINNDGSGLDYSYVGSGGGVHDLYEDDSEETNSRIRILEGDVQWLKDHGLERYLAAGNKLVSLESSVIAYDAPLGPYESERNKANTTRGKRSPINLAGFALVSLSAPGSLGAAVGSSSPPSQEALLGAVGIVCLGILGVGLIVLIGMAAQRLWQDYLRPAIAPLPTAKEALRLTDQRVERRAIKALARSRKPKATELLIWFLSGAWAVSDRSMDEAFDALEEKGISKDRLMDLIRNSKGTNNHLFAKGKEALLRKGASHDELVDLYLSLAQRENNETIAEILVELGEIRTIEPALAYALEINSKTAISRAIDALVDKGISKERLMDQIRYSKYSNDHLFTKGKEALVRRGASHDELVNFYLSLARQKNDRGIVEVLEEIGDARAIEIILAFAINNGLAAPHSRPVEALNRIDAKKAATAAADAIQYTQGEKRGQAVLMAVLLGGNSAKGVLRKALTLDNTPKVTAIILKALVQMKDTQCLSAFMNAMNDTAIVKEFTAKEIEDSLAVVQGSNGQMSEALLARLKVANNDDEIRHIIESLAAAGDRRSLIPVLDQLKKSTTILTKYSAAELERDLGRLGATTKEIVEIILVKLEHSQSWIETGRVKIGEHYEGPEPSYNIFCEILVEDYGPITSPDPAYQELISHCRELIAAAISRGEMAEKEAMPLLGKLTALEPVDARSSGNENGSLLYGFFPFGLLFPAASGPGDHISAFASGEVFLVVALSAFSAWLVWKWVKRNNAMRMRPLNGVRRQSYHVLARLPKFLRRKAGLRTVAVPMAETQKKNAAPARVSAAVKRAIRRAEPRGILSGEAVRSVMPRRKAPIANIAPRLAGANYVISSATFDEKVIEKATALAELGLTVACTMPLNETNLYSLPDLKDLSAETSLVKAGDGYARAYMKTIGTKNGNVVVIFTEDETGRPAIAAPRRGAAVARFLADNPAVMGQEAFDIDVFETDETLGHPDAVNDELNGSTCFQSAVFVLNRPELNQPARGLFDAVNTGGENLPLQLKTIEGALKRKSAGGFSRENPLLSRTFDLKEYPDGLARLNNAAFLQNIAAEKTDTLVLGSVPDDQWTNKGETMRGILRKAHTQSGKMRVVFDQTVLTTAKAGLKKAETAILEHMARGNERFDGFRLDLRRSAGLDEKGLRELAGWLEGLRNRVSRTDPDAIIGLILPEGVELSEQDAANVYETKNIRKVVMFEPGRQPEMKRIPRGTWFEMCLGGTLPEFRDWDACKAQLDKLFRTNGVSVFGINARIMETGKNIFDEGNRTFAQYCEEQLQGILARFEEDPVYRAQQERRRALALDEKDLPEMAEKTRAALYANFAGYLQARSLRDKETFLAALACWKDADDHLRKLCENAGTGQNKELFIDAAAGYFEGLLARRELAERESGTTPFVYPRDREAFALALVRARMFGIDLPPADASRAARKSAYDSLQARMFAAGTGSASGLSAALANIDAIEKRISGSAASLSDIQPLVRETIELLNSAKTDQATEPLAVTARLKVLDLYADREIHGLIDTLGQKTMDALPVAAKALMSAA